MNDTPILDEIRAFDRAIWAESFADTKPEITLPNEAFDRLAIEIQRSYMVPKTGFSYGHVTVEGVNVIRRNPYLVINNPISVLIEVQKNTPTD